MCQSVFIVFYFYYKPITQLKMFHQSFRIEGWQNSQPSTPISHRHQLRPLEEIIEKSKLRPNRPQLRLDTISSKMHTNDGKSFHSLKEKMKRCYTEDVDPIKSKVSSRSRHDKLEQMTFCLDWQHNTFNKTRGANEVFNNIVTLIEKEPTIRSKSPKYVLKHIKNAVHNHPIFPHKRSQSFHTLNNYIPTEKPKIPDQKIKVKRVRRKKINSTECLVILPKTQRVKEEQPSKEMRSFYMKMIEGFKKEIIVPPAAEKNQQSRDNRWKKIINKTHRKKKDLDELFKTRAEFKKGQDLEGSSQRKIFVNTTKKPKEDQLSKIVTGEFDDDTIYCPWSYQQQKLSAHIRSKLIPN